MTVLTAQRVDLGQLVAEVAELAPQLDLSGDPDGLALDLLRRHRMFGFAVPGNLGGLGLDLPQALAVAQELGGASAAVGVVWVMHCQQVAIVRDHAPEPLRSEVLRRVAAEQQFLGSVTTEPGKGGHVLTAHASLEQAGQDGMVRFRRDAPVVSGGAHADAFLVTVRRSPEAEPGDVLLVHSDRAHSGAQVVAPLEMLGMRATGNVRMTLDAQVPRDHVIDPVGGFARITMRTLAPWAHLGWSACWIGAAREALRTVVRACRAGDPAVRLHRTDAFDSGLARVRCRVDAAEALLLSVLGEYERLREPDGGAGLESTAFQIALNNLKVFASESTRDAADELVELAGLGRGYLRGGLGLERVFRDLRSATLMYANDRLVRANGRLALMDRAALSFPRTGLATRLPRWED